MADKKSERKLEKVYGDLRSYVITRDIERWSDGSIGQDELNRGMEYMKALVNRWEDAKKS